MIVPVHPEDPQPRVIDQAARILEGGGLVVYPTDTAYGIGCDISNRRAIERIYQIKRRDRKHSLSVICADLSSATDYALLPNSAFRILKRCLPGPYTLVLPASRETPRALMPKRRTVGIRVPDHPVPLALTRALGRALCSGTACLDGAPPFCDPYEIEDTLGHAVDMVLDVGPLEPGRLSTVVDLTDEEPEILRYGIGDASLFE
jgi:tRNA threonylcarbamoyl adenosine modification protein (Sua5/YciO/YrdC/YwlC family)